MDILSFINSNTIRDHLEKIEYNFHSLEVAWLIFSCKKLSYEEKKAAWLELIETMPDCEVPQRLNCIGWPSLHNFLKEYIEIMDSEIADILKEEPIGAFVYRYSYLYTGDERWTEEFDTVFPSLNSCLEACKKDIADLDETFSPKSTGVIVYKIKKQSLSDPSIRYEIEFRGDGKVTDVFYNSARDEKSSDIIDQSFEGLWFDFPTPFKKGDIVWIPKETHNIRWDCDGGFVLEGLSTWDANDFIKNSGDYSDMNGYGYFVNPNGTVYHEVMFNYMDLELYPGPYKLNEKILPALSKYVKGEIEVDFLLCAYRKILLDIAADDIMLKSWYPEDWVKELGL